FFERFDTPTEPGDWQKVTKGIASYDRARGERHAKAILRHRWDLVIIDEAHKVKNHKAATYQFIQKIDRNYLLLLTATPLQLELIRLSQRLCSSAAALAESLQGLSDGEMITPEYRMRARELATDARRVKKHAKLQELERILESNDDRLIVFSEHLPTLALI